MKVDISPNLPPISSWTIAAPAGSGSDGGGSSVWSRSIRRITGNLREKWVRPFGPNPRRPPGKPSSGFVSGIYPLCTMERELVRLGAALSGHGLEQERVVIAGVEALDHAADEAVRAGVEQRRAARPGAPRAALELVDLVARLAAEELGELRLLRGDEVDAEQLGVAAHAVGAVLVREADEEPRGVDARLRGEADQAARALAAGRHGDDEHRVVEVADERVERRLRLHRWTVPVPLTQMA